MKDFLKTWGLLLSAIVIGVLAFYVSVNYLNSQEEAIRRSLMGGGEEVVSVVVATTDLAVGEVVGPDNMAVADMAAEHVSSAAVRPEQFDEINGAVLKVPLSRGEALLMHSMEGRLVERFSELLQPGERAVTLEVSSLSSNSSLLSVGDYIDVFYHGSVPSFAESDVESDAGDEVEVFSPLMQRIQVLAVERFPLLSKEQMYRTQGPLFDSENYMDFQTVTLRVKDKDANQLTFASTLGEIYFLLRHPEDTEQVNWQQIDKTALFDYQQVSKKGKGLYLYGKSGRQLITVEPLVVQ